MRSTFINCGNHVATSCGAGVLHALRVRVIVSSLFLDKVSIFYLSGVFIGPFDIEILSSRDRLFILDTLWFHIIFKFNTELTNEEKLTVYISFY